MEDFTKKTAGTPIGGSSDTIDRLLGMLSLTGKKYNTEKIRKAYEYSKELHEGQFRNSGDPYITHPIAVAEILASLVRDVYPKIEAGLVKPTIYKVLPITEAEAAHAILQRGENVGKVVLTV